MKLELRLATLDDAPELADLQRAAWEAAFLPLFPAGFELPAREDFIEMGVRALRGPRVERAVALAGDRIAGLCTHGPSRDEDASAGVGEIRALFVHPDHWRHGVGTALVAHALDRLRERGCQEATLWSFRDGDGANVFYESQGFRRDGATQARATFAETVEMRYRKGL